MTIKNNHIKGLVYAATGALVLSPDGLLVRLAGSDEWVIVFWRGLFVAGGLFIVQMIEHKAEFLKKFPPQNLKQWGAVIATTFSSLTFVLAIKHTTVANTLIILSTMSLFAALFSMIFLKERIALRTGLAMFACVVGIGIVFMDGLSSGGMLGNVIALLCAFFNAANLTIIRSERTINVPSMLSCGALMAALIALMFASSVSIDGRATLILLAMGTMGAGGFVLVGTGAKYIPSPEVTLLLLLETIVGPIWVWMILQEIPSINALIGGAIVISALGLHALAGMRALKKLAAL